MEGTSCRTATSRVIVIVQEGISKPGRVVESGDELTLSHSQRSHSGATPPSFVLTRSDPAGLKGARP